MLSSSTKILLETLAAVVVVLLLAGGYGLWRLSEGPWSVPALGPVLETALSDPASGRSVTVGETLLIWEPDSFSIGIELRDANLIGGDGAARARIAEMHLKLSGIALLRGRLAPTEIAIIRPNVQLRRDEDGSIALGFEAGDEEAAGQALADPHRFAQDWLSPSGGSPLAGLQQLRLVGSNLTVNDRFLRTSWRARDLTLTLSRTRAGQAAGVIAKALFDFEIGEQRAAITLDATYDLATDRLVSDAAARRIDPAELARHIPALAMLAPLQIPIDARLQATSSLNGDIQQARLSLSGSAGQIVHPAFAAPLSLEALATHLTYDAATDIMTIEDVTAALEHRPVLSASGRIQRPFGATAIEATAKLVDLPLDALVALWPVRVAPGGRQWVQANLSGGTVRGGEARIVGGRSSADQPLDVTKLDCSFDFSGLRVLYIPRMPAVEQVSGTGRIDLDHLSLAVASGRSRGITIAGGTIDLLEFEHDPQTIVIDLPVKGALPDILALLNEPPLGFLSRFDIPPAATKGTGDVRLQFKFPAIAKLQMSQVQVNAAADVTELVLPKLIKGNDLTDGTVHLDIDRNGLKGSGRARIGGTPAALKWTENFARTAPFRRRLEATGTADDATRRAFGLDFMAPYVTGPAGINLTYTDIDGRRAELTGTTDFRTAKLSFAELGWSKPAAVPATGRFALRLADGDVSDIVQAEYEGAGLQLQATGRMEKGDLVSLDLHRLATAQSDLAGSLTRQQGGGWNARLRGSRFDAHRWFEPGTSGDDNAFEPSFPLGLDIEIGRVLLDQGEQMGALSLRGRYDGTRWQQASLRGHIGSGDVSLTLEPGGGSRRLDARAADAGRLLKALGLTDKVEGGTLHLTADVDNRAERLTGRIEATQYQVRRAGVFAQLLALISITGIPNVMSGDGIAFQSFNGDFVRTHSQTEITRAQASGLSIGLTARGSIARKDGKIDVGGLIVPINTLNRVIGAIPLLGDILTGGPGGGLFAVSYRLSGTAEDPSVSVNPVSWIAPGILRTLIDQFRLPGRSSPAPLPEGN